MIKDEFDLIYTKAGASGMNAFTNQDMTVYFITVPSNKLELWFWMESDRLANHVFREFYSERDVVHEERRLRTESTPTGKFDELFEAMFWESHPYSWPVVGWPTDLKVISKAQAEDYFSTYYAPNNLTAALVGNFDAAEAKELAQRYFGRIPRGAVTPPDVVTLEMPQLAGKQMEAECDCQPQIQVTYHSVPFRHKDSYALEVLSGLMNGQTGRLYKSLVLDKQIATSANANQDSRKWSGTFSFTAETKGKATPEQLEAAWSDELKKIIEQPIPPEELQKVKNQIAADAFRRLDNPFFLMVQLLVYDGFGDWTYIQDWAQKTMAVSSDEVKAVAKSYLTKESSSVGRYNRKAGSAAEEVPPEIAALPADIRPMVQAQLKGLKDKLATINDPKQVQDMLDKVRAQEGSAPDPFKKVLPIFATAIEDRLKQLPAPAEGGK
jgi:predicted Zn-dependent peptidase